MAKPLWAEANPLEAEWQTARQILEANPTDQSFWINWYERFLHGKMQNWEMLEEIALTLKPEDWEKSSAHVNGMIAEIQAKHTSIDLPQADILELDEETGKIEIRYLHTSHDQIIETSLSQISFSLKLAASSNCGLNSSSTAHAYLTFAQEQCRNNPNAILQNYQIALSDIRDGLKAGRYFEDPKLTALDTALIQQINNLLANHPEVKEADLERVKHALSMARVELKTRIVKEVDFAKAAAGIPLEKELNLDEQLFSQTNPSDAQAKATQRYFGRVAQMFITLRNATASAVRKMHGSSGFMFTKIMQSLEKAVSWISDFINYINGV